MQCSGWHQTSKSYLGEISVSGGEELSMAGGLAAAASAYRSNLAACGIIGALTSSTAYGSNVKESAASSIWRGYHWRRPRRRIVKANHLCRGARNISNINGENRRTEKIPAAIFMSALVMTATSWQYSRQSKAIIGKVNISISRGSCEETYGEASASAWPASAMKS